MFCRDGMTSAQPRVFRPQSGFTQIRRVSPPKMPVDTKDLGGKMKPCLVERRNLKCGRQTDRTRKQKAKVEHYDYSQPALWCLT